MLGKLILFFTLTPILELAILIPLAQNIGLLETILIILLTGIGGAYLARREGVAVWRRIIRELQQNQMPKDSLLDGLAVLIAGAFMITPGVLTDVAGVCLLVPFLRKPFKKYVKNKLKKKVEDGSVSFTYTTFSSGSINQQKQNKSVRREEVIRSPDGSEPVIDVTDASDEDESNQDKIN